MFEGTFYNTIDRKEKKELLNEVENLNLNYLDFPKSAIGNQFFFYYKDSKIEIKRNVGRLIPKNYKMFIQYMDEIVKKHNWKKYE